MNKVIDKAMELGQAITNSSEYLDFQNAKTAIEDLELLDTVALVEKAHGIIDSNKFDETSKVLIDARKVLEENKDIEAISSYIKSKEKLAMLLDSVNGTLAHITGMDTGKCGGCNGCGK